MVNRQPHRNRGVKVLKAVSSPLRLQILNLLFDKNALSYTELMNQLKMNPSRDAGRFAYHLKFLLKASLVEADVEAKKYYLTDLGKMLLDVADRVERKAVKPRGMLVRTSHLTMEDFDANKIANSLIKEAKVPAELAQKTAKEAEKRLFKSKTKYLTTSLIREVVNGILIEKGYEDYRHKLTRLGLPVNEVTALIESREEFRPCSKTIMKAGETVLSEYTLLNIFPRDVADAHLSGAIHIEDLGTWILTPFEIIHDLRYFFQNGVNLSDPESFYIKPPTDFESALSLAFNVLLHSSKETNRTQTLNYFNVFLAPFAKGTNPEILKENLKIFILNLNQHTQATLGLELSIPKQTVQKEAVGVGGKQSGKYGDFTNESLLLASLVLDVFIEECSNKPMFNPKIVVKIDNTSVINEYSKVVLLKAHQLALDSGIPYFASLNCKEGGALTFSSSGIKFMLDLSGDWETDTLRTGCLGGVTINLPRIAIESNKDKNVFIDLLKERFELSARALGIKNNVLKKFGKNSLPFLMQKANGDTYFRLENCSRIVNLAGFREAVETFTGKSLNSEEGRCFAENIITDLLTFKQKLGRKYGKRLYPALLSTIEASERLAQLDIERYGVAKVKFSGTRDKPYYSVVKRIDLEPAQPLFAPTAALEQMQLLKGLTAGGSLDVFELVGKEFNVGALMDLTCRLIDNKNTDFFIYSRVISYCENCKKKWFGILHKCPSCGSMSTLTIFDRFKSTYT